MKSLFISLMVVAAMLIQPMIPLVQLGLRSHLWQFGSPVAQAEEGPTNTIYLPVVTTPPGPPAFEIISPADGATISGVMYFAVQASNVDSISSVTFMAGDTTLGTDSTAADGLRTFLDVSDLPAGQLELSAMATGISGETSKSITVNVVPNPPSSGTVESDGGVFASEIGSVITIPPGGAPDGTTVSVTEMTQEQVTAQNGFDWDAMGVTFLGAQDIESSTGFSKPLGVASANFGNRVQPGQAVVNYQIMPDADGDGVDELIVVNTASVAPNNDVISDPVSEVILDSIQLMSGTSTTTRQAPFGGLSGAAGSTLTIEASGLNPLSIYGNLAIWTSSVDGQSVEIPVSVTSDSTDDSTYIVSTVVPSLPVGNATLVLHNESTNSSAEPITVNITAAPALIRPATEIIDTFWSDTIAYLKSRPTSSAEQAEGISQAVAQFMQVQNDFQTLIADDLPADVVDGLNDLALMIQNSEIYTVEGSRSISPLAVNGYDADAQFSDFLGLVGGVVGTLGAVAAAAAATTALPAIAAGAAIGLGIVTTIYFACKLLGGGSCLGDPPSPGTGSCSPTPAAGGGSSSLRHQGGGGTTTGMGAAPPPGGDGCGSAGGGGSGSLRGLGQQAGRYLIKIFVGGSFTPFTGMSDAGGYFYVPFIPEEEPFTAFAFDSITGETRTFEGVGPATGDSLVMFFNFFSDDNPATSIEIGQVVTSEITQTGQLDFYTFDATAGQEVFFDVQAQDGLASLNWQVLDREANTIFNTCLGCSEPGVHTLDLGGTYTLIVGEADATLTGTYQFQLWDVPAPDEFSIAIGDVISDGVPGPGAGNIETPGVKDVYTFNATAGQKVYFDVQEQNGLGSMHWEVVDQAGSIIFATCLACTEAGAHTLTVGGTYSLTVGDDNNDATGTYQLQLWNVPAPDEFSIAIGDTVSDGLPAAGAGNIETPGVKDVYTFNATAGQKVYFDVQEQNGLGSMHWEVVDQEGSVIFATCLGCTEAGAHTLTVGGTYSLTVGDDTNDATGTYQLQLWNVPAPDEFSIAIGDTVSDGVPGAGAGNIETPGVKDVYTFNATAGEQVYFDIQKASGVSSMHWEVVDQSGSVIFATCLGCTEPGVYTLELGGTYTLTVGDDNNDATGTYQFQLWDVPASDEFSIAIGDTVSDGVPGTGAGNIESPGAKDIYTFNATAGQQVNFDLLTQDGVGLVNWRVVDQSGTEIFDTCLGCSEPGVQTLSLGGTYTITVGDDGNDGVGTYSFQISEP